MKRTKILAILMACACLLTSTIGGTIAWFTDEAATAKNVIQSGNLDVELYYQVEGKTDWTKVEEDTNVFMENALWEPGHTEVVKLKVVNEGSLALKYQLGVNVVAEEGSTNKDGAAFKLSDHIKFGVAEGNQTYNREQAAAAVDANAKALNEAYSSKLYELAPRNTADNEDIATMVVYMPTTVGNEANHAKDATAPTITLGINLFATQLTYEDDSFGDDYDDGAFVVTVEVTPDTIQAYLDGQHGSLVNTTLKLAPGNYGVLTLGRPTKYAGSKTQYTCSTHDFTTKDAESFNAHMAESGYHTTPKYTTVLRDVTILGTDGAKVSGVLATSGHAYGDVHDYVRDIDSNGGSAYYSTLNMKNVTFRNVEFTGGIDINTSDENTAYDGILFDECSFTTDGTASANGPAIRYYNESSNGKVRNITVKNSTFKDCYQGIYVHHVSGVAVIGNTFDNTGHNAIAMQNHGGSTIDLKNVVIRNNTFKNIGDRVIRFGDIGADSDITIEYNTATNSGDEDKEVIKATTIAAGVKTTVRYNDWGDGRKAANPEFEDTASLIKDASALQEAANAGGDIELGGKIAVEDIQFIGGTEPFNISGGTLSRDTGNGNPLTVNTTEKVTFSNVKFESVKGGAVLATRKTGANIEVNDCDFTNYASPSTGNVGVQVYATDVTMTFNRCTFNNMPIITSSSYAGNIKLEFNDCTFKWEGANCPGMVQLANNVIADVDFNNCKCIYDATASTRTSKLVSTGTSVGAGTAIDFSNFTMEGTAMEGKIWSIVSKGGVSTGKNVVVTAVGTKTYTFNGVAVDFDTYLFG